MAMAMASFASPTVGLKLAKASLCFLSLLPPNAVQVQAFQIMASSQPRPGSSASPMMMTKNTSRSHFITTGRRTAGFCVEDSGYYWLKVYQINEEYMQLDAGAVGDVTEAGVTHNAKFSDATINSLAAPLDGYSSVYRLSSTSIPNDHTYIRTNQPYVDTTRSFGSLPATACQSTSYDACSTWWPVSSGWGIDHFGTYGEESCKRYMLGHGSTNCWDGPSNYRCVSGGSYCIGCRNGDQTGYARLWNAQFYLQVDASACSSVQPTFPSESDPDPANCPAATTGTPSPTMQPTTVAPSGSPTATPTTASPTATPTAAPTTDGGGVTSFGDPHLSNLRGQRFDIKRAGNLTYLAIPRTASGQPEGGLLHLAARVEPLGDLCDGRLYVTGLSFAGQWLLGGRVAKLELSTGVRAAMEARSLQVKVTMPPAAQKEEEGGRVVLMTAPALAAEFGGGTARLAEAEEYVQLESPSQVNGHVTVVLLKLKLGPAVAKVRMVYQKEKSGPGEAAELFSNSLWLTVTGLQRVLDSGVSDIGGILGFEDHAQVEEVPEDCRSVGAKAEAEAKRQGQRVAAGSEGLAPGSGKSFGKSIRSMVHAAAALGDVEGEGDSNEGESDEEGEEE